MEKWKKKKGVINCQYNIRILPQNEARMIWNFWATVQNLIKAINILLFRVISHLNTLMGSRITPEQVVNSQFTHRPYLETNLIKLSRRYCKLCRIFRIFLSDFNFDPPPQILSSPHLTDKATHRLVIYAKSWARNVTQCHFPETVLVS